MGEEVFGWLESEDMGCVKGLDGVFRSEVTVIVVVTEVVMEVLVVVVEAVVVLVLVAVVTQVVM